MALEDKIDALIKALDSNTAALKAGGGSAKGGSSAKTQKHTLDDVVAAAQAVVKKHDKAALKPFVAQMGFKVSETPDDKLDEAMALVKKIEEELDADDGV